MRPLFGFALLIYTAYVLNGCTSTQLPSPKAASSDAVIQMYHNAAQDIILDSHQPTKRSAALDVQDYVQWAKQSSNEREKQAYLQKAYETLREISN